VAGRMEGQTLLVDTSILIDYFRKKRKERTFLYTLSLNNSLAVSTVTEFELIVGLKDEHAVFAAELFERFTIFPVDSACVRTAAAVYRSLKAKNRLIPVPDIFIAATAITNGISLATLNTRHFQEIEGLLLLER
jgi:tRNA(fMet)-specific endonuclease VapC